MIMTLMTKLYDNLLRINNQPLQLLYLMAMMIMVKMTTTMSENVTKYEEKNPFFFLLNFATFSDIVVVISTMIIITMR